MCAMHTPAMCELLRDIIASHFLWESSCVRGWWVQQSLACRGKGEKRRQAWLRRSRRPGTNLWSGLWLQWCLFQAVKKKYFVTIRCYHIAVHKVWLFKRKNIYVSSGHFYSCQFTEHFHIYRSKIVLVWFLQLFYLLFGSFNKWKMRSHCTFCSGEKEVSSPLFNFP